MQAIKKLYKGSFLAEIIAYFKENFVPALKNSYIIRFFIIAWEWYDRVILNSKIVRLLFHTPYFSELWYKSYFYRRSMRAIRSVSFKIPRSDIKYRSYFIGIFMAAILLIPDRWWWDLFWIPIFFALAILYMSRSIRERRGTVFALINVIIVMFMLLIGIALPYSAVKPIIYLLIGIDFFFLISFSVSTFEDLGDVLKTVFISSTVLCGVAFIQNIVTGNAASATFYDGVSLGEILIIIFPFVFAYPNEFESDKRRFLYMGFVFIAFLNAISATQSKAAFIGFLIEVLIFMLADIKRIPFILLLLPLGLSSVIENFRRMWETTASYGNVFTNMVDMFRSFWNTGFGVNSKKILDIYNSAELRSAAQNSVIQIPYISNVYINLLIDIGAVAMFAFLYYILRLAHSSLTLLFVGDKKYRNFFAAGLSMLIGISVSAFFENTLFAPRTLLIYWGMMGVLRAVRIMSFGVYES